MAEIKKMGYCVNGEWKESKAEKYMEVRRLIYSARNTDRHL